MIHVNYYNASGKDVPSTAKLTIQGVPKDGDALVVVSFDGTLGTCKWMSEAEVQRNYQPLNQPAGEGPPKSKVKVSDESRDDPLR